MVSETMKCLVRGLALLAFGFVLTGCSSKGRVVEHSFGFDIRRSVPAVEVLDYRYGISGLPGTRAPEWMVKEGKPGGADGIYGAITVGDFLYVKWRLKESGEVFEDNVDLRHRLPDDMKNQRVYFDIKGPQLYVYLISPERLPPGESNGLRIYWYYKMKVIYPDSGKQCESPRLS